MERVHESYVNKPLYFHMPTKLKHFTQLAKNTQFFSFYYPPLSELTVKPEAKGGSSGNIASGNSSQSLGGAPPKLWEEFLTLL